MRRSCETVYSGTGSRAKKSSSHRQSVRRPQLTGCPSNGTSLKRQQPTPPGLYLKKRASLKLKCYSLRSCVREFLFVGADWSEREESKESARARVMAFLTVLSSHGEKLSTWFDKGRSRAEALRSPIPLDAASIAKRLTVNRRDADR